MAAASTTSSSSSRKKASNASTVVSPLPLPPEVWNHHSEGLLPLMRQWSESRRVPPVLLLTGPKGIGKRAIAHHLAQWLLCSKSGFGEKKEEEHAPEEDLFGGLLGGGDTEAPSPPSASAAAAEDAPCGECANCQRALHGNWLDFKEIAPESSEDGRTGQLKIEQFRELKASQGYGAHEGAFRITLIVNADHMTPQAANSVLKILEEPPKGWVFILTASDASLLLPTLVSRCQRFRLRPFSVETLEALLAAEDVPSRRRRICALLAQGSWEKARFFADEDNWEIRGQLFRFLERPQGELSALVDWASQDPKSLELLLDQLEQMTLDLIHGSLRSAHHSTYHWLNEDGRDALEAHTSQAISAFGNRPADARAFWIDRTEAIARVRRQMQAPLNRKLLVQDLLLPWLSL